MSFLLNYNTQIVSDINEKPVVNAVNMLKRDIEKVFNPSSEIQNRVVLHKADDIADESYKITVADEITVTASDNLGFVYGLLYISEKYLGIKPFWFWLDQKIEKKDSIAIDAREYNSKPMAVRFRGWFFNDEVLFMKWNVGNDENEKWRMAFESLLRCGGNMTIPGTDKNARLNRQLASDMGLWITHHHAEPLGAEMFARAYPGVDANFNERPEMFYKLWEDAVEEQKDYNVVWNLCFRGQGDQPFWSSDTTGEFNTPEKRGAHISAMIRKQCDMVRKHVKKPVFCTNLYGEIMELYEEGHIDLDDGVIKVQADNGYGKMVTRRRDNHNPRVSSKPVKNGGSQGIYYHVSFYDLQAANHITMLPNSVDFVNNELNEVLEKDGNDFWVINCSNVKPHAYYLDVVRKKWSGRDIDNETQSIEFANDYYNGDTKIAKTLSEYASSTIAFGEHDDEHAGEQFYTEAVRIIANSIVRGDTKPTNKLNWIVGTDGTIYDQTRRYCDIVRNGLGKIEKYFELCKSVSDGLMGDTKKVYDETVLLQAKIHYYCAMGMITFGNALNEFEKGNYKKAFVLSGDAAVIYDSADKAMRDSESGVWEGFYLNECFADCKHSAYMIKKVMGTIREFGDNARHDKWYREFVYSKEDRNVFLLLVTDNHYTDEDIYKVMKEQGL